MFALHKIHHLKLKLFFFPCPGRIMIFLSLIIYEISETMDPHFNFFFMNTFLQHLDASLKDLQKLKYPHRNYFVFLNNLMPVI